MMRMKARLKLLGSLFLFGVTCAILSNGAMADDKDPLKIGVLGDYTSVYASVGGAPLFEAAKMAVEDSGGKALGKPIEIISGHSQLKPDIASTIARRWFDEEKVDMITDLPSTNIAFAVTSLANERKKILMVTSASGSAIAGEKCSPYVALWTYDAYSNAVSMGSVLMGEGAKKWFILSQDTVTGAGAEKDLRNYIEPHGGKIVGIVKAPVAGSDFSSYLVQAQSSGADVMVVLPAGSAGVTAIKQAVEFGLPQSGMKLVSFFMQPDDVRAIGLEQAQGLYFVSAFVWDLNDETKAFSDRFLKRTGKKPNANMVGTYSAVKSYIAAVNAAGTKDADAVMKKLRETKISDVFTKDGHLLIDGRFAHSTYVVQVKTPAESKGEWDIMKMVEEVPTSVAVRSLADSGCPLVK
jgi:branched-chain amino acid transport system substrate-binding protein